MTITPHHFSLAGLTSYALLATGAMPAPAANTSLAQAAAHTLREDPAAVLAAFRPYQNALKRASLTLFHGSVTAPGLARSFERREIGQHPLQLAFDATLQPAETVTAEHYLALLASYIEQAQQKANNDGAKSLEHFPPQLFGLGASHQAQLYESVSARSLALLFLTHELPLGNHVEPWIKALKFAKQAEGGGETVGILPNAFTALVAGYIMLKKANALNRELVVKIFLDYQHPLGAARSLTKGIKDRHEKRSRLTQHAVSLRKQAIRLASEDGERSYELYQQALTLFQAASNVYEEANTYVAMALHLEDHHPEAETIANVREKAARLYAHLHALHTGDRYLNYLQMAANLRNGYPDADSVRNASLKQELTQIYLSTQGGFVVAGAFPVTISYANKKSWLSIEDGRKITAHLKSSCIRELVGKELARLIAEALDIPATEVRVGDQRQQTRMVTLTEDAMKRLGERYPTRHRSTSGAPDSPSPLVSEREPGQGDANLT